MDESHLGPAIARLGPLTQTSMGRLLVGVHIASAAVALLFIVSGLALLLLLGIGELPTAVPVVLALLFGIPGLVMLIVNVLGFLYSRRIDVIFHEHGLTLQQSWWRTQHVRWADVAAIQPPAAGWMSAKFECVMRTGLRVRVERLHLKAQTDGYGRTFHHPDVQRTLNAHAEWRQKYAV